MKRELDYKIILSCLLLENEQSAVIAQHDYLEKIMLKSFNGVYIGKNVMTKPDIYNNPYEVYEKIKINNISVIHLDEEGGIHAGNDDQIKETLDVRIDAKALDSDDYLFIWGEFQSKHYISKLHKNSGPKIINTDFVKFDFTKKN